MSEIRDRISDVVCENGKLKRKLNELIDELNSISAEIGKQDVDILDYSDGYQKGLEDAWECVRRLEAILYDAKWGEFSDLSYHELINTFLPTEVIAILEAYEDEQKQIRVGDEVESYLGRKYIIYKLSDDGETACGLDLTDYPVIQNMFTASKAKKTGRHFDEIETMMEKMRGEE